MSTPNDAVIDCGAIVIYLFALANSKHRIHNPYSRPFSHHSAGQGLHGEGRSLATT